MFHDEVNPILKGSPPKGVESYSRVRNSLEDYNFGDLDRRVAEGLGWTRVGQMPNGDMVGNPPDLPEEDGFFCVPTYSTSVLDAMLVVDYFQEKLQAEDITLQWNGPVYGWYCRLIDGNGIGSGREAPTLPHAICLAMIAYLEEEAARISHISRGSAPK